VPYKRNYFENSGRFIKCGASPPLPETFFRCEHERFQAQRRRPQAQRIAARHPSDHRARRPRALVTTPASTRNARPSMPAPARRVRSSSKNCPPGHRCRRARRDQESRFGPSAQRLRPPCLCRRRGGDLEAGAARAGDRRHRPGRGAARGLGQRSRQRFHAELNRLGNLLRKPTPRSAPPDDGGASCVRDP